VHAKQWRPAWEAEAIVLVGDLRRIALVTAIVATTLLPQTAVAQTADDSAPSDQDIPATVVDDAAPADTPEQLIEIQAPAPIAPAAPTYQTNARYLSRLQAVRTGWITLEVGVGNLERQLRLGTVNPSRGPVAAGRYPAIVDRLEQALDQLSPPPQFAYVHQLHVSAAAEFRAAMGAAESWLTSGSQDALLISQTHFDRFDSLIGQALLEIG
jgi:hypothetical protein